MTVWWSRLAAFVVVLGIVLSPLRARAAMVPMRIAYDAAVRPTATTALGRHDALRSEAERPGINDYDGARPAYGSPSEPRVAVGLGEVHAYDDALEHAHGREVWGEGAVYDAPSAPTAAEGSNIVYRGLAAGEDATAGLVARAPGATNTPLSHVAGKIQSQWISTTKDLAVATQKYGANGVVAIDLSKVGTSVVDLSAGVPGARAGTRFWNYAVRDSEVLIQGSVPADAILWLR